MKMQYNYDILTCIFLTNNCSHESGETSEDTFLIPESTNEELEERRCSPESEIRHRASRYAPYNRQTKITGKQAVDTVCTYVPKAGNGF